jgi:tRNA(Ile)-lysidine synthase
VRGARPQRDVEAAIERSGALRPEERVLIACSGGADSMALTAALHAVARRLSLQLRLAHVNHGARTSAWQDECIVLEAAARFDLPLDILPFDGAGENEAQLREARYDLLARRACERGCSAIVTAHHAQDQSETVLMALLRGSGPDGLSGMPLRRALTKEVDLARPLLGVDDQTLRAYCHALMLPYGVDPTNADTSHKRNAVREALDALRPHFPGMDRAVARAADVIGAERQGSRRAELRRSVRERFAAEDALRDVDFAHVEAAVRAMERGRTGTFLMKSGLALRIERGAMKGIVTLPARARFGAQGRRTST